MPRISSHFGDQVDDPLFLKEMEDIMADLDQETRSKLTRYGGLLYLS